MNLQKSSIFAIFKQHPAYGTAPFKNTNKKRGCPRDILAGVGGVEPPITESKSVALPLGYTPIMENGSYPANRIDLCKKWGEWWGSNPRITEPQSAVLTTSPHPPHLVIQHLLYNGMYYTMLAHRRQYFKFPEKSSCTRWIPSTFSLSCPELYNKKSNKTCRRSYVS